jgi:tripartite-type tricarboxylate transporter receptor subunit TctC
MPLEGHAKLDEIGTRLNPMTPEKFTGFLPAEIAKYQKVAQETGVRME